MATGTGTQEDPYVVSTMADFITYAATASVYVKLANDIDVSQDATYRDGLTSPIYVDCSELDLDGHTVKNFIVSAAYAIFIEASGSAIKNGKILNFVHRATGNTGTIQSSQASSVSEVDFSFTRVSNGYRPIAVSASNTEIVRCSFYVNENGTGTIANSNVFVFGSGSTKNAIVYNGRTGYGSTSYSVIRDTSESYLVGNLSVTGTATSSARYIVPLNLCSQCYSAMKIDCSESTPYESSAIYAGQNCTSANFIVGDKITEATAAAFPITTSTTALNLTTAQAEDQSYLLSIGFLP